MTQKVTAHPPTGSRWRHLSTGPKVGQTPAADESTSCGRRFRFGRRLNSTRRSMHQRWPWRSPAYLAAEMQTKIQFAAECESRRPSMNDPRCSSVGCSGGASVDERIITWTGVSYGSQASDNSLWNATLICWLNERILQSNDDVTDGGCLAFSGRSRTALNSDGHDSAAFFVRCATHERASFTRSNRLHPTVTPFPDGNICIKLKCSPAAVVSVGRWRQNFENWVIKTEGAGLAVKAERIISRWLYGAWIVVIRKNVMPIIIGFLTPETFLNVGEP